MASVINPTEPWNGKPAATAGLRADFQAPKTAPARQVVAAKDSLRIDGAS